MDAQAELRQDDVRDEVQRPRQLQAAASKSCQHRPEQARIYGSGMTADQ